MNSGRRSGEIYIEYKQVGKQVQVTAIDAATGIEVSAFGPLSTTQEDLNRLAIRKLQRRLEKEETNEAGPREKNLY